jgi:pilus assembly protein CpaC
MFPQLKGLAGKAASALLSVLALAVLPAAMAGPAQAQAAYDGQTYEVVVPVGKSQVIQLPTAYADIMIADPKIADVLPLNTHSVYVVGKGLGATALTIYGPNRHLLAAVNVVVSVDIESFKARLHEILPDEKDVAVRPANQSLVLSGTASSPVVLQQIVTLAGTYAPDKVVNMMTVQGTQQVMLEVRFVEMERTTAKNLRLNVSGGTGPLDVNGNHLFTVNSGDTFIQNAGALLNTFGGAGLGFTGAAGDLNILMDALETKGLIKTLAEPNLTAQSGETASFLAGGEFPIPVASSTGTGGASTITIAFKQFGISLAFTPTILKDGLVNMIVAPEVSSIDPTTTVSTNGISVPGIKVRRANTTVELRDGESFTIAGLLKDDYQNSVRQFPFVGDVPVLGALFRSTGYQRDETELVIVVTPHLVTPRRGYVGAPTDHFVPPSDFELFLLGAQRGSGENIAPADRALMSADPTKGGIDGPHGHILY